jgi:tripartite-type tricarboxylate transporter receptor subunit TctC
VIENRGGAGGTIGTTAVIKSPPDGYTLVLGSSATITAGPAVYKHPPYQPF